MLVSNKWFLTDNSHALPSLQTGCYRWAFNIARISAQFIMEFIGYRQTIRTNPWTTPWTKLLSLFKVPVFPKQISNPVYNYVSCLENEYDQTISVCIIHWQLNWLYNPLVVLCMTNIRTDIRQVSFRGKIYIFLLLHQKLFTEYLTKYCLKALTNLGITRQKPFAPQEKRLQHANSTEWC